MSEPGLPNNILISSHADIDIFPSVDIRYQVESKMQLSIGDLHGNALKFIYFLVRQQVLEISQEDYNRIVDIYKKNIDALTKSDLIEFSEILSGAKAHSAGLIRLVGDELADRGKCDYFTLKILEKLTEANVPVEILLSNHSVDFLEAIEVYEKHPTSKGRFLPPRLSFEHAISLFNLEILIASGSVERDEVLKIANSSYKPCLKAIGYTLSADETEITIFSHAAIDLEVIKGIAKKLAVAYQAVTAKALAQTIENINHAFAQYIESRTVHTLYSADYMMNGYIGKMTLNPEQAPFEFLMWNRVYNVLNRSPEHPEGYKLNYVHGHDDYRTGEENVFNLDNMLGKSPFLHQGEYLVLASASIAEVLQYIASVASARTGSSFVLNLPLINPSSIDNSEGIAIDDVIEEPLRALTEAEKAAKERLLNGIQRMKDYGELLQGDAPEKASVAINLASQLTQKVEDFYTNLPLQTSPQQTQQAAQGFKVECYTLLNQAKSSMAVHRAQWKPIVINIMIALTGIGLVAIGIKAVCNFYREPVRSMSSVLSRNSLFWMRTKSEQETLSKMLL